MEYNKPLSKCKCGKHPKLSKNDFNYVSYSCEKCALKTFHTRLEEFSRELWNAMLNNIKNLKVRI